MRLRALQGDLENSKQNVLTIRAPYDGVVISLAQRNAGSVVQNGQELCQLSRAPIPRRAPDCSSAKQAFRNSSNGQTVRSFFDAFPYQRYGVVPAKLDWISPSAVTSARRSALHRARLAGCADRRADVVRSPSRVGMTGEARIVVGQRTIMEYAFEPIRQLRENVRD